MRGATHHHGLLSGLGAGTAAVLLCGVFVAALWHRLSGQASIAVAVMMWAVTAAVVGTVAAGWAYAFLFLRHRVRHPETLSRRTVRAEVLGPASAPPGEIPAAAPAAELTAGPLWRPRAMYDPVPEPQERGHE